MGRKKRSGAPLSHEEIWDDSALVQSWDDAVEEYNVYIHTYHLHFPGDLALTFWLFWYNRSITASMRAARMLSRC